MSCENNVSELALLPSRHPAQPGLQRLMQQNKACEHAVDVSASKVGNIRLSLRYQEQDCPWCLRRLWLYWRGRAKGAEGQQNAVTTSRKERDEALAVLAKVVAWHGVCQEERCWCVAARALSVPQCSP